MFFLFPDTTGVKPIKNALIPLKLENAVVRTSIIFKGFFQRCYHTLGRHKVRILTFIGLTSDDEDAVQLLDIAAFEPTPLLITRQHHKMSPMAQIKKLHARCKLQKARPFLIILQNVIIYRMTKVLEVYALR